MPTLDTAPGPDAYAVDLAEIDVSLPQLMQRDIHWDYFARLRDEAPVHYCQNEPLWFLLVHHALQPHYGNGEKLAGLFVGCRGRPGRPPARFSDQEFYWDGPAAT